jgi:hypothetical protein
MKMTDDKEHQQEWDHHSPCGIKITIPVPSPFILFPKRLSLKINHPRNAQTPDGAHSDPDVLKDIRTNLIQQGGKYSRACLCRMFGPVISGLMKTHDPNNKVK